MSLTDHAGEVIRLIDDALSGETDTRIADAVERTLPFESHPMGEGERPSYCWRCSRTVDVREASWLCHDCVVYLADVGDDDPVKKKPETGPFEYDLSGIEIGGGMHIVGGYTMVDGGPPLEDFGTLSELVEQWGEHYGLFGNYTLTLDAFDPNTLWDTGNDVYFTLRLSTFLARREFSRLMFLRRFELEGEKRLSFVAAAMARDMASEIRPLFGVAEE